MLTELSPKALLAFLVPAVAAALLWLVTGDNQYLVGILAGVVAGGAAVIAPPAAGVKQSEVADLAARKSRTR